MSKRSKRLITRPTPSVRQENTLWVTALSGFILYSMVLATVVVINNNGKQNLLDYSEETLESSGSDASGLAFSRQTLIGFQELKLESQGQNLEFSWTTSFEFGTNTFVVEKSEDGYRFEEVERFKAMGDTMGTISYRYLDQKFLRQELPEVYYRIKHIDKQGNSLVSPVTRYYRPSRSKLHLKINYKKRKKVLKVEYSSFYNTTLELLAVRTNGKVKARWIVPGTRNIRKLNLDISKWEKGLYFIELNYSTHSKAKAFQVE